MTEQKYMQRSEWLKTPYAGSTATKTEDNIASLLSKYGVNEFQWTQGQGQNKRPAVQFRFVLKEKMYRVMIETLWANASRDELMIQAKRVIYYYVKSAMELATVFVPMEKALFAFLELPDGTTMFEGAQAYIDQMQPPDFSRLMCVSPIQPALPAPSPDTVDGEVVDTAARRQTTG